MTAARKLSEQEINSELEQLPGWSLRDGKLHRSLEFQNFRAAFAFMTEAALISERLNHHPDWSNSYARVSIELVTHSIGGLSNKDFEWARSVNAIRGI